MHTYIYIHMSLFIIVQGRGGFRTRAIILIYQMESVSDSDSGTCNSPSSYRQPSGRGQSLSRRYCKHSVWLYLCAFRTAL